MEPGSRAGRQKVFDCLAMVGRQAIPDHEQLAGDASEELLQEADDAGSVEGGALRQGVDLAVQRQGADDGEMVAGELAAQDRRLTA